MKNSGPPKSLSREAKAWWRQLIDEYEIDDRAGLLVLQTALEAFDRMRDAQKVVGEDGMVVLDRFRQQKAHPMLTVERDARSQMIQALKAHSSQE